MAVKREAAQAQEQRGFAPVRMLCGVGCVCVPIYSRRSESLPPRAGDGRAAQAADSVLALVFAEPIDVLGWNQCSGSWILVGVVQPRAKPRCKPRLATAEWGSNAAERQDDAGVMGRSFRSKDLLCPCMDSAHISSSPRSEGGVGNQAQSIRRGQAKRERRGAGRTNGAAAGLKPDAEPIDWNVGVRRPGSRSGSRLPDKVRIAVARCCTVERA